MNTYEGLFIFTDGLQEDALAETVKTVRSEIEKAGGAVVDTVTLGRRTFARTMRKKDAGQYVQIVFQMLPSQVNALRARFRLLDRLFRVQVTRMNEKELALFQARNPPVKTEEQ